MILENLSKVKGFETIASKKKNSAFIVFGQRDDNVIRGLSNFGNIEIDDVKNLNVLDLLKYKILIMTHPKESVAFIESKLA